MTSEAEKRAVHLRTLGCRLNQSEIDAMARQFSAQGGRITSSPEDASLIVVNTCAVTHDAERTGRHLIRQLHRSNPGASIVVTGCHAQIAPDEILTLPGVTRIIPNAEKDKLVQTVSGAELPLFDREPLERNQPPWMGRTRAFIKAQDGCDNACTFCVTTIARGPGRSRPVGEIIDEINALSAAGYREVVLTGVHLGSYGRDGTGNSSLRELVHHVLLETDVPRVRLSSLEPWDLDGDFFELWANPRLCPSLHLPLQSGCDATLRRMRRHTSQAAFRVLIQNARAAVPDVCITTDVIVGFPCETDDEFAASIEFISEMDFAGLHVFRYSRREGTAAARMRGAVPESVRRSRAEQLSAYADSQRERFALRQEGSRSVVLWENVAGATSTGFINVGYTANYVRVHTTHSHVLTGQITDTVVGRWDARRQSAGCTPLSP
jgi:threonylcarbamoyladenosine tRNA methylthiotransferase MtaB